MTLPAPLRRSRVHHPLARPLAVTVTAGALLAGGGGAAWAHDRLDSTEPASGASVATAPGQVVLHFEEAPLALGARVLVTGPDGVASAGDPQLDDDDLVQPLQPGAPAGTYTVEWRVTSDDGHPVDGSFTFTAGGAAAGASPSTSSSAAATEPASAEPSMTTLAEPSPGATSTLTATPAAAAAGSGGGISGSTWAWTIAAGAAGAALGAVLVRARNRSKR